MKYSKDKDVIENTIKNILADSNIVISDYKIYVISSIIRIKSINESVTINPELVFRLLVKRYISIDR